MLKIKKESFVTDKWDHYGNGQYRTYLKLTDSQLPRIADLKNHIGENVLFISRGRLYIMKLMWVSLEKKDQSPCKNYMSYPFQFRLNYTDGKFREHDGFWSTNIDNLHLMPSI